MQLIVRSVQYSSGNVRTQLSPYVQIVVFSAGIVTEVFSAGIAAEVFSAGIVTEVFSAGIVTEDILLLHL